MGLWEVSDSVLAERRLAFEKAIEENRKKDIASHEHKLQQQGLLSYYEAAKQALAKYDLFNYLAIFNRVSKNNTWNGFKLETKYYHIHSKSITTRHRDGCIDFYELSKKIEDGSRIIVYSATYSGTLFFDFKDGEWVNNLFKYIEKKEKEYNKKRLLEIEKRDMENEKLKEQKHSELLEREKKKLKIINRFTKLDII